MDTRSMLNAIWKEISHDPFFSNKSLGSGTGNYIVSYDPKDELIVRDFLSNFREKGDGFEVQIMDLYDIMIQTLEGYGYLEAAFDLEEDCKEDGKIDAFISEMTNLLQPDSQNDVFVKYIQEHAVPGNVIFLTGVGKCHPFIRAHKILNNFDGRANGVKIVMFYPGTYDYEKLVLFNTIESESYYKALKLIESD